jgi:hypothetical protein
MRGEEEFLHIKLPSTKGALISVATRLSTVLFPQPAGQTEGSLFLLSWFLERRLPDTNLGKSQDV